MKNKNSNNKYPVASKILTWILYIIIFVTIVLGWLGGIYSIKKGYAEEVSSSLYYYRSNEYTYTNIGAFTPERYEEYSHQIPEFEQSFSSNSNSLGSYQIGFSFEMSNNDLNSTIHAQSKKCCNFDILMYNTWWYGTNNYMQSDITSYRDWRIVFSDYLDIPDTYRWFNVYSIDDYKGCDYQCIDFAFRKFSDNTNGWYGQLICLVDTCSSSYIKPENPVTNPYDFICLNTGATHYLNGSVLVDDDFFSNYYLDIKDYFIGGIDLTRTAYNYFCFTTSTGARFMFLVPYYTYNSINVPNPRIIYTANTSNNSYKSGFDNGVRYANTDIATRLNSARTDGYNDGYYKAKEIYESGDFGVMQLADAFSFGILKPIYSLLNFNVLGINFFGLVSFLVTLSFVLFIIRTILGN